MNSNRIMAAVMAALIGVSGVALAQDRNDRGHDQRGDQHDDKRDNQRGNQRNDHNDRNDHTNYSPERRNDRTDYRQAERHDPNRGAGPRGDLRKGGRLPAEYRNRQYVVNDWRGHHLNAPPRGYQWVQTGSDYVLVAITTGIIASLLLSN